MREEKAGGPAFPCEICDDPGYNFHQTGNHTAMQYGMTLRDYFAAAALPAVIGTTQSWKNLDFHPVNGKTNAENDALCAYQVADAMLKARATGEAP